LYADDGALVAESVEDLQRMLDALKAYCAKWRMFVNVDKTEAVVFNRKGSERAEPFFYDGLPIKVVESFKYLGLLFHESGRKVYMIKHRLLQSKRAFAIWKRRCSVWLLNGYMAERLFKVCVLPVLEYGINIWGVTNFSSSVWKEVEQFWRMAARAILRVPMRTPTAAVLGDLGWRMLYTRAVYQGVCLWTRATNMADEALVRKAMCVQRECLNERGQRGVRREPSWLEHLRECLCRYVKGKEMWDGWMAVRNFRVETSRVVPAKAGRKPVVVRWEDD
jgi:hypothetical protein